MTDEGRRSNSFWAQTKTPPARPRLEADARADVCVVGGGIAGLSTAYLLSRAGRSVVLIEDGRFGEGQTAQTTAHLSNAIDDRYVEIERLHGEEGSRLAAESHTAAIDRIESIAAEEAIDCDFVRLDGFLFNGLGQPAELLDRELEAAHRAGLAAVERLPRAPLESFDTGPCLRFPRQGQFHPLKYLAGLAAAVERRGGRLFGQTHATSIEGGRPARIVTSHGPVVTADSAVVATNTPINDRVAIHTKQAPYLSFVIGAVVPAGSVHRALYWDTLDPYHYVRLQPADGEPGARELLIVGGEDVKTGHADDADERFARLEAWARPRFPTMESVPYRWAGQVMEPVDAVAFIGRNPLDKHNVYIATGDSGMGMTHGMIAGILLSDLIAGRENPWAPLYDPGRKSLRAAATFAKENLDVAMQYTSWATPGDVKSLAEIASGAGALVREGLSKLAVYRDERGTLHKLSAVCPHLGCVVEWNSHDRTWDCPCHGSRFDCTGNVINGPANRALTTK